MVDDYNFDRDRREAIAASETSVERLEQLAREPDVQVRKIVASNPNTPAEILLKLGEEFPDEVIENPMFSLLLLEDLGSSDAISLIFALSSSVSAQKLTELATHSNRKILIAVARNANTPASVLHQLFSKFRFTQNQDIYQALAYNPSTPPEALSHIVNHSNLRLLAEVARNPSAPASLLENLAASEDENIRRLVQVHPNISTTAIDIINFMDGKPEAPAYILERMAWHSSIQIRLRVASQVNTPLSAFQKIIDGCDQRSRWKIACYPNLSPLALEALAEKVVREHFQNPHLHPDYPPEFKAALHAMQNHPNRTSQVLRLLGDLPQRFS